MTTVKMPAIFKSGVISEGDSRFKGDVTFDKSLILSSNSSLTLPVNTKTTGRQFEVRINPSDGNMEIYDTNGWRPPFKSSVRYDTLSESFVAEDNSGSLFTFLVVEEGGSLEGVPSITVDPVDGASNPAVRFKGFPNSGFFGDAANGWAGIAVSGKAILTAKGSGVTIKRFDEQETYIVDFQKSLSTVRSNFRVEGDLNVTGQLSLNGQVISQDNVSGFSDKRLKEVHGELELGLDSLDHLKPYRYYNTKTKREEFGVMAQDLQKIDDSLVSENGGYLMVNHYPMINYLLAMVIRLKDKLGE